MAETHSSVNVLSRPSAIHNQDILPDTMPELLRSEFSVGDVRRLPFVHDDDPLPRKRYSKRSFWAPEYAFPGFELGAAGTLCGAAYLLYLSETRDEHYLATIVATMPRVLTSCEIGFLSIVEEYSAAAARFDPWRIRLIAWNGIERGREALARPRRRTARAVDRIATALSMPVGRLLGDSPE